MILILDENDGDPQAVQQLLCEHGFSVSVRRDDADMKASEEGLLLAFMEHFVDGIVIVDVETAGVKFANKAFADMLGYSVEEARQKKVWEWEAVWSREDILQMFATRSWLSKHFESRVRCKDGRILDVAVSHKPIVWQGCEVVLCVVKDIAERKKTERLLQHAKFTLDKASVVVFWADSQGNLNYVNEAACTSLGYSREELLTMTIMDIDTDFSKEDYRKGWQHLREVGTFCLERHHRARDGRVFPVEVYANLVTFEGKEYHFAFITDISDRKRAEKALRDSESKYRSIVENAPFGITRSSREGKLLSANPALAAILKYDSVQELMDSINSSSIQQVLFPEPGMRQSLVENIFASDAWYVFNNRLRCKDGSIVTCRVHSRRILNENGEANEFESYQENITEQLAAEQALRESEEKFRVLAETSPVAICLYQGDRITYANSAMERLFGYCGKELCQMKAWDWVHEDDKELVRRRTQALMSGESVPRQCEVKYVTRCGDEGHVMISAGAMAYRDRPTGVAFFLDITERKRAEEMIRASLKEKDVLLREIHHRVKNNLQVISSLLFLQSQKFDNAELQNCFLESQSRICSMSLAHEQLYQSNNLADISIKGYLENLVAQQREIFAAPGQKIACRLMIEDHPLDIQKIVPCGLLVTELLSNAYKHAFGDNDSGQVTVSLTRAAGRFTLIVADNGMGLPADFDYLNPKTLGLQLVTALVNQLNGTLEVERRNGTRFVVCFPG